MSTQGGRVREGGAEALIAGGAVVTLDPYTARRGPRVARAVTAESELVGHGDPWTGSVGAGVTQARQAGAA